LRNTLRVKQRRARSTARLDSKHAKQKTIVVPAQAANKARQQVAFTLAAWQDYTCWQSQDRKTLKRINQLIDATLGEPFSGIGKPEALRENLSGFWSRRIDETNRLVYAFAEYRFVVVACKYHF
jgi:toxin YoeB